MANPITLEEASRAAEDASYMKLTVESDNYSEITPDGKEKRTITGMNTEVDEIVERAELVIYDVGFVNKEGDFAIGKVVNSSQETLTYDSKEWNTTQGPFPVTVDTSTPNTSSYEWYSVSSVTKEEVEEKINLHNASASAHPEMLVIHNADENAHPAIVSLVKTEADRATTEADRAQDAADSASSNAKIYTTVSDGIADTNVGDTFSVASGSEYAYTELYEHVAGGIGEYLDSSPNKNYVSDVVDNFQFDGADPVDGEDVVYAITDESGSTLMTANTEGDLSSSGKEEYDPIYSDVVWGVADEEGSVAIGVSSVGAALLGGEEVSCEGSADFVYAIADETGAVALGIDHEGNVVTAASEQPPSEWAERYNAEDMYLEWYGQSLSIGAQGLPLITTTQDYSNKMFASGIRWDTDEDLTAYVPLVETEDTGGTKGETGIAIMTNYLTENSTDYTTNGTNYIGSSSGLGGQRIDQLNKGTTVYNRLLARLEAGFALSNAENRSFNLWQLFWTQGEADYAALTEADTWKGDVIQLQNDIADDAKTVCGQTFKPPMIMYQCAAHLRQGVDFPNIALAQAELGNEQDDMYCSHAMYNFDYFTDYLHLTNDGYVMLGKYYGAAAQELKESGTVSNLHIERVINQGKVLEVQLSVPNPPLVLDITRCTETYNYGFDIYTDNVLNDIIDTVEIIGTSIKIITTETIPEGSDLRYANGRTGDPAVASRLTGPRGNIRDSRGDTLNWINSAGDTDRADNWLLISNTEIV